MLEVISKKVFVSQNKAVTIKKMKDVTDIYASIIVEQKCGLSTKEYILIYDYEKREIVDGDLIAYGTWYHLDKDELEEWTTIAQQEHWF
ncbi:hypothetical protein [Nosocomiicoccus sp. HMSC059G07]|uniref:hypothetical protein n=1 Tax=Nosocomiicoccus sp. HMSC059G07 TaxID=1739531 RepID=UPI0008A2D8E5|nr:hypothetical protein [Nosocomiicoccus sp. HMSC059G07]OFO56030.1 hypothetical protein HMPREF3029_02915 [Nosocomiicoccus sp. HMSC059G07]